MTREIKRRREFNDSYRGIAYQLATLIGLYWFSSSFFLAKRNISIRSGCNDAIPLLQSSLGLTDNDIALIRGQKLLSNGHGCWMDRRVDSVVILVVDALRFDFARNRLPISVGARLSSSSSQLLKFVADPPTVTMQRLKGMTTGGLPTFADISGNFGGASIDEDNWVSQLHRLSAPSRGLLKHKKLAFVGDDTWIDLFPTQFDDAHPFPSFNTRDLNTVDNGCVAHLPRLLNELREKKIELVVAHFLGVDHVGHTYGPHNQHMDRKLKEMDTILDTTLESLDAMTDQCSVAFIFGDHGMTEDGNHGGGTDEEINAGLFVHFSRACGDMSESWRVTGFESGIHSKQAFETINQIDLVSTISLLMGIPIPYANLGGIVPSLFPPINGTISSVPFLATALALNAAQVWNYLRMYSDTLNRLPNLPELQQSLHDAVLTFKDALSHPGSEDSLAYRLACSKFKIFLHEATELGKRVWTRFDTLGMFGGATILFTVLTFRLPFDGTSINVRHGHALEASFTLLFVLFHCILLTFSNSYIEGEMHTVMFFLSVLSITISYRLKRSSIGVKHFPDWLSSLLMPLCSRFCELVVTGHGLDPSIRHHWAHHASTFLFSLGILAFLRTWLFRRRYFPSMLHFLLDMLSLIFIAVSWLEKRSVDSSRNGFLACRLALAFLVLGISISSIEVMTRNSPSSATFQFSFKIMLAVMVVSGPSTGTSVIFILIQSFAFFQMASAQGVGLTTAPTLACLWRFTIRHTFFVTNHACTFSRLQYSAAFIATNDFSYVNGGLSLFLNTFGWEILGLLGIHLTSRMTSRPYLWRFYCFYQLMETVSACVSVSLLRRHLMVWATFAPRFLFSAIFLVLHTVAGIFLLSVDALQ